MGKDSENLENIYAFTGAILIRIQKLEFLVHEIISHFKTLPKHKRFKGLNAKVFLSSSEEDIKKRKQTLG